MMNIMFIFVLILMIANLMMLISIMISKKSLFDREKTSPFECGFDQKSSSRLPFSLRFFLITIIFLIFDVEIALILPAIPNLIFTPATYWLWLNLMFISILLIGLYHEWNQGMLEWNEY